jgi:hypothetical protein
MSHLLLGPMALALTAPVLAACNQTTTEPETTEVAPTAPEFAVATNSWITGVINSQLEEHYHD